ncbi:MAG: ribosome-associated translation inhibitor RaiA [Clostridia bacterium]
MQIEIMNKNYYLDDGFKEVIIKKLTKFDKYFDNEADAKVKLTKFGNDKYTMEISINAKSIDVVRSSTTTDDMKSNLDIVLPKLERQIVKHRKKLDSKFRVTAFDTPVIYNENNKIEKEIGKVVKVKNFNMDTINISEAMERMELLDHDFYVFNNIEHDKISILYLRNDGDYGLIEAD